MFVKLQPYRQTSVVGHSNQKLSMRYFGPFKILEHIGPIAYRLQLPDTARIQPMFRISLLKKCEGDYIKQLLPPALPTNEKGPLLLPWLY